jgi:hypothetical protein
LSGPTVETEDVDNLGGDAAGALVDVSHPEPERTVAVDHGCVVSPHVSPPPVVWVCGPSV